MKEYGVYTIKTCYLKDFLGEDNKLSELKISTRPWVCIKLQDKNWLVPLSSINPQKMDYFARYKKQRDYNYIDNHNLPKAMQLFDDITKTGIEGFKSVAQYYNALPVKHKYCNKYRNKQGEHIVIDNSIGNKIKGHLINYLKSKKQGHLTGFIKYFVEQGRANYRLYPIDCFKLQKALYKKHFILKRAEKERKACAEQRNIEAIRKKELKNAAKEPVTNKEKVEIEPLRIFKQTDEAVLIKLPGATVEQKTPVWLPRNGVLLNKEGDKIVGVREDLQQKYSLKLLQGQPKRFLK